MESAAAKHRPASADESAILCSHPGLLNGCAHSEGQTPDIQQVDHTQHASDSDTEIHLHASCLQPDRPRLQAPATAPWSSVSTGVQDREYAINTPPPILTSSVSAVCDSLSLAQGSRSQPTTRLQETDEDTIGHAVTGDGGMCLTVDMNERHQPVDQQIDSGQSLQGVGLAFAGQPDGRVPSQHSDRTIYGVPDPYYVDLFFDTPQRQHWYRGMVDTGSFFNILATSVAREIIPLDLLAPVPESHRIRGLSRSSVAVRGQLTITVRVQYGDVMHRKRAVWDVVDDENIGAFDALVGRSIIHNSELERQFHPGKNLCGHGKCCASMTATTRTLDDRMTSLNMGKPAGRQRL